MNVSSMMKAVGRFIAVGPTEHFVSGQSVTLLNGHTITMDHLTPPRTYVALSAVTFILSDDPGQLDTLAALVHTEPKLLQTGPKPGETWKRKGHHESDSMFNFACVARDDFQDKWFVLHRTGSGDAFVISMDDFYSDRHSLEQV